MTTKTMSFSLYAQTVLQMAVYPDIGNNLIYPGMGLIGEVGEVAEHLKRIMRDDKGEITPERGAALKIELGDVLWYVSAVGAEFGCPLADVTGDFDDSEDFECVDPDETVDPMSTGFQMAGFAARVGTLIDSGRKGPPEVAEARQHLYNVVRRIARLAWWCGFTLSDVMQANIDKLKARRDRGTLQGSGDKR